MPGKAADRADNKTYATRVPVTDQPKWWAIPAHTPPIMASRRERLIPLDCFIGTKDNAITGR